MLHLGQQYDLSRLRSLTYKPPEKGKATPTAAVDVEKFVPEMRPAALPPPPSLAPEETSTALIVALGIAGVLAAGTIAVLIARRF